MDLEKHFYQFRTEEFLQISCKFLFTEIHLIRTVGRRYRKRGRFYVHFLYLHSFIQQVFRMGTFKNRFTADWFAFNRNVNNILIALTARKYGFDPAFYLVGDDVVTKALAVSGARDFGLGTELDYMDDVIRIHDMSDPVEKERKLDLLKWEWLEDRTFFCYFSVERLFAFLIKLDIIERWTHIDKERGGKVFRSLVEQLKNEVEIPQEFKK